MKILIPENISGHMSYQLEVCKLNGWTLEESKLFDVCTPEGLKIELKKSCQLQLDHLIMAAAENIFYLIRVDAKKKKWAFLSAKEMLEKLNISENNKKEILAFRKKFHQNENVMQKCHLVVNIVYPKRLLKTYVLET